MARSRIKRRDFLALGLAAAGAPSTANAALFSKRKFPNKPIRVVVPFGPGSGSDFVGRLWAETARAHLGTLVIENQSGGTGSIGGASVARSKPDGYTLLVAATTTFVLETLLKKRPLYNPVRALTPVSSLAISAFVVAVNPAMPAGSLKELAAYAAAHPQKVTFGSGGVGSMGHLTGEMFKSLTKTPSLIHVPYRGGNQLITDTIGGQISMLIAPATDQILELHKSGKLKILAVTSPGRLLVAPEIPTAVNRVSPVWWCSCSSACSRRAGRRRPLSNKSARRRVWRWPIQCSSESSSTQVTGRTRSPRPRKSSSTFGATWSAGGRSSGTSG